MNYWHETANLALDTDGTLLVTVYELYWDEDEGKITFEYDRRKRLGAIEDAEDEAGALGLAAEYDEHLDLWRDSQRGDYAGDVRHDYRVLQGI